MQLIESLTPGCLGFIGRELIRNGETVLYLAVEGGRLRAWPCADWDVNGQGPDPMTWTYRVNVPSPDKYVTFAKVPAASVLHFRYQTDPGYPYRGISPMEAAAQSGRLSAELTKALADEASGARGNLLPIPMAGDDPKLDPLKLAIKRLNGGVALVESMGSGWNKDTMATRPMQDWEAKRLGMNPPLAMVELQKVISDEVFATCGTAGLFNVSDAAGKREAYRQFLHSTVMPTARLVEAELTAKMEAPIQLNFDSLMASDISGRARAFQSMVGGGLDVAKAAALSGLMTAEA